MGTPLSTISKTMLAMSCGALLYACGGSSSSGGNATTAAPIPTTTPNTTPNSSSTSSFSVTDAPVDNIEIVKITFSRIDIKPVGGESLTFAFDTPVVINNLLELTGNNAEVIAADISLPPGDYSSLSIYVDGGIPDSSVTPDADNITDLFIPGQQNGNANENLSSLQLNTGFTVPAGGSANFTIDFDLRKGLTKPSNSDYYLLRPALRLVNNVEVGSIRGMVAEPVINHPICKDLLADSVGLSAYLYEGNLNEDGLKPDDIFDPGINDPENTGEVQEADGVRPIASADVVQNESGGYEFTIGFVQEVVDGYSVAFSCKTHNDDPGTDDDIRFTEVQPVLVVAGETSQLTFEKEPTLITP